MGGCRASPIGRIRVSIDTCARGGYPLEWAASANVREWAGVTARIANGGLRDEAATRTWELHAGPPLRKLRVELSKRRGLLRKIANVMRERLRPWLSHLALYRCNVFIREPPSVMKPYAFVATPIPPPRRHRRSSHGVVAPGPAPHVPIETQSRDPLLDSAGRCA